MIRAYTISDLDVVLEIWLSASIKAHDFVAPSFWQAQVESMRNVYLPASEIYVAIRQGGVAGFYALHENSLAAIFVKPELQGQGIGRRLISHAKNQRTELTLSVYKENQASCRFYLDHGFTVIGEQKDAHTGHFEYTMRFGT